jgi:hypothetical protein
MPTDRLSDAAILAAVEDAMRLVGNGKASLAAAGEALMRRILGLEHRSLVERLEATGSLNLPATNTGD